MQRKRVVVAGAGGRMGREVVRAVLAAEGAELVGAVDTRLTGEDAGELAGAGRCGVSLRDDLEGVLRETGADVLVDFTTPAAVMENARRALAAGVVPLIGTTGLGGEELDELHRLCEERGGAALVAPNFALGAVLLMRFAQQAARYFPHVEIIELHHDQKLDAPSGTAMKTAEAIAEGRRQVPGALAGEMEKVAGARGGVYRDVHIHAVRLPGLVAHEEVIFGGLGQTLTLRHDSLSRESFMPGVLLAISKAGGWKGLVYGLEHLLED